MLPVPGWLEGRVAIVSGGGAPPDSPPVTIDSESGVVLGTGRAIARLLAAAGAHVVVLDRDQDSAAFTVAEIGAAGFSASASVVDVTDRAAVDRAVVEVGESFGRLDVLVNNAAVVSNTSITDMDAREWDRVLDTNLRGAMHLCSATIPLMRVHDSGSIVNLVSAAVMRGFDTPAYAASKGGLMSLTSDLAASQGQFGIRVNAVLPGHVRTPMAVSKGASDLGREQRRVASPLLTEASGWDVAWAVLFLASEVSRWTTGAMIPVDGGMLVSAPMSIHQWGASL